MAFSQPVSPPHGPLQRSYYLIGKCAEEKNRKFIEPQMANQHIKIHSTLLITREMQIKMRAFVFFKGHFKSPHVGKSPRHELHGHELGANPLAAEFLSVHKTVGHSDAPRASQLWHFQNLGSALLLITLPQRGIYFPGENVLTSLFSHS